MTMYTWRLALCLVVLVARVRGEEEGGRRVLESLPLDLFQELSNEIQIPQDVIQ